MLSVHSRGYGVDGLTPQNGDRLAMVLLCGLSRRNGLLNSPVLKGVHEHTVKQFSVCSAPFDN
jgi:hypothetical protein